MAAPGRTKRVVLRLRLIMYSIVLFEKYISPIIRI